MMRYIITGLIILAILYLLRIFYKRKKDKEDPLKKSKIKTIIIHPFFLVCVSTILSPLATHAINKINPFGNDQNDAKPLNIKISLDSLERSMGRAQNISSEVPIDSLVESEIDLIENYVKSIDVEKAVGQLFITGIPQPFDDLNFNTNTRKLITDIGIGGVFIDRQNYKSNSVKPESYVRNIINFHNNLQIKSINESKLKLPLLFTTDYESSERIPFSKYFIKPPSSLTLSCSQNQDLVRTLTNIIGYQLSSIGVHIILGPVIDMDMPVQNESISRLDNRSFGSNSEHVFNIASQYIIGLKETGVYSFIKHFPSYGSTVGNIHKSKESPIFIGGASHFEKNSLVYRSLSTISEGLMTMHAKLELFGNDAEMVTFSKQIVSDFLQNDRDSTYNLSPTTKIRSMNYSQKILITDDLSNIDAIENYKKEKKWTKYDVAIEAFNAGHDMLLYGYLNNSNISTNDLKEIKDSLSNYILDDQDNITRFRKSLRKIVILKAKIAKRRNISVKEILNSTNDFHLSVSIDSAKINQPLFLHDTKYLTTEQIVRDINDSSMIEISNRLNFNYDLTAQNKNTRICCFIDEYYIDLFKDEFKKKFRDRFKYVKFYELKRDKSKMTGKISYYDKHKKDLVEEYRKSDIILFSVVSWPDDNNLLESIVSYKSDKLQKAKVIAMMHCSPTYLKTGIYPDVVVFGNFNLQAESFMSDIKVLSGRLIPKNIKYLPISIGMNESHHSIEESVFKIKPATKCRLIQELKDKSKNDLIREIQILMKENKKKDSIISSYDDSMKED